MTANLSSSGALLNSKLDDAPLMNTCLFSNFHETFSTFFQINCFKNNTLRLRERKAIRHFLRFGSLTAKKPFLWWLERPARVFSIRATVAKHRPCEKRHKCWLVTQQDVTVIMSPSIYLKAIKYYDGESSFCPGDRTKYPVFTHVHWPQKPQRQYLIEIGTRDTETGKTQWII